MFKRRTQRRKSEDSQQLKVHNISYFFRQQLLLCIQQVPQPLFFEYLKQIKDKNSTALCKSKYQLCESNQQNYKAIKERKEGTSLSVMDINEGSPVTKILIINMEFNRGARVNFPTIMKNASQPLATTPGQDFRFTSH